ncbi:MAG: type III-A CRISPR-associated RAMP protein Csm4 [Paludibacteraceae bacterium]|nr:type III-A CRISPR-associated RAMP protein Csm4 [Paludibacteraceae bacterium]
MAKQQFIIYKLHFTTPLHLGDSRDDYSVSLKTINSDTMYAALISCLAKLGQDISKDGDLGCTISNLFPFYQKDRNTNAVYFFPKPLKQTLPTSDKATEERKKIKKVTWLDEKYFSKILKGEQLFDDNSIDRSIKGLYMTDMEIDKDFMSSQVSSRVTVSRNGQEDAKPFHMDRVVFKDYSGFFFLAKGDTSSLEKAMDLLQCEGIGTDRNVGNGYFEYEVKSVDVEFPDSAKYTMSLSSFIPESKEQLESMLASKNVAYDFQRRGGWITTSPHNTLRKNVIYSFSAGSVFKLECNSVNIYGKVGVDLKPDWDSTLNHPIWRCGRALFLPIKVD